MAIKENPPYQLISFKGLNHIFIDELEFTVANPLLKIKLLNQLNKLIHNKNPNINTKDLYFAITIKCSPLFAFPKQKNIPYSQVLEKEINFNIYEAINGLDANNLYFADIKPELNFKIFSKKSNLIIVEWRTPFTLRLPDDKTGEITKTQKIFDIKTRKHTKLLWEIELDQTKSDAIIYIDNEIYNKLFENLGEEFLNAFIEMLYPIMVRDGIMKILTASNSGLEENTPLSNYIKDNLKTKDDYNVIHEYLDKSKEYELDNLNDRLNETYIKIEEIFKDSIYTNKESEKRLKNFINVTKKLGSYE